MTYTDHPEWTDLTGTDRHAACLHAARLGNRAGFDALVNELTPLLWHVARTQGVTRDVAEDIVQTVWLLLLRHLDQLDEPRAVAAWLITTTRREAIRARHRKVPFLELSVDLPAVDPSPECELLRTERDRDLWAAFNRLPARCQELLRLTVLAGRACYETVADTLHMPVGSIGPTRGRCLERLRTALRDTEA